MKQLTREDCFADNYEEQMVTEVAAVYYIANNAAEQILDLPKLNSGGGQYWDDEIRAEEAALTLALLPVATAIHLANLARP